MCVGITIIKWDSTCHSQTHGTEPPVHFCCSHYISPCFLSTSPFHSLSLSCFLFLSLSLYLCPLFLSVVARHMSSDALYQIFSSWSILLFHTISFHSSYKIHQLFTDYLLRLPSSELLEKHLFRSRANRRLVSGGRNSSNRKEMVEMLGLEKGSPGPRSAWWHPTPKRPMRRSTGSPVDRGGHGGFFLGDLIWLFSLRW